MSGTMCLRSLPILFLCLSLSLSPVPEASAWWVEGEGQGRKTEMAGFPGGSGQGTLPSFL